MRYLFNPFNLLLATLYIIVCYVMSIGSSTTFIENIGVLFFEIAVLMIWATLFFFERKKKKLSEFSFDLFVMTYVFVLAISLMLIFEEKNADVLGWWPFFMVIGSLFGFLWSLVFAGFAVLMGSHERYTKFYALIMLVVLILNQIMGSYRLISEKYYFYVLVGMLVVHVVICMYSKAISLLRMFKCVIS